MEPLAGRALENLGRKRREERQKVHFFVFFKKQENIRKIKVFSSLSPAALSGNISLDGLFSLPLAGCLSVFDIFLGDRDMKVNCRSKPGIRGSKILGF